MNARRVLVGTAIAVLVAAVAGLGGWWMGRRSATSQGCECEAASKAAQATTPKSGAKPAAPAAGAPAAPPQPGLRWKRVTPQAASAGGTGGKGAWIGYVGKSYDPPIQVQPVTRDAWKPTTPEEAYRGLYAANMQGDRQWLLECYAPSERAELDEKLTDEALADAKHQISVWSKHEIVERIEYGPYVILLVRLQNQYGGKGGMAFAFKRVDGRWYATNELADDPFATVVWEMAINLG